MKDGGGSDSPSVPQGPRAPSSSPPKLIIRMASIVSSLNFTFLRHDTHMAPITESQPTLAKDRHLQTEPDHVASLKHLVSLRKDVGVKGKSAVSR